MNEKKESQQALIIEENKRAFIIVYETIYKNTDLTAIEISLLVKLLSAAPTFKPTIRKLATILKVGATTLTKAVKNLQEKGYLRIEHNGKGGSVWKIDQNASFKPVDIENLKELCQNAEIDLKTIKALYKMQKITRQQAQELNLILYNSIQRIIRTNWLD